MAVESDVVFEFNVKVLSDGTINTVPILTKYGKLNDKAQLEYLSIIGNEASKKLEMIAVSEIIKSTNMYKELEDLTKKKQKSKITKAGKD